jgi:RNA polymerase-binding protein DksA
MAHQLDLKKFRALLEEERVRVQAEIDSLRELDSSASQSDETGDLSHYDQHQADTATETFERERDVALEASAEGILRQIEVALQKIDDGTYGVCERCGKPIGRARLEALPYAAFCIVDAERFAGQT